MKRGGIILFCLFLTMMYGFGENAHQISVNHPFMLWTPDEISALKQKVQNTAWRQEAYREMKSNTSDPGDEMRYLFRYAVMDDQTAGQALKDNLMDVIYSKEPLGGALVYQILAYDVLYNDFLTPEERDTIEQKFRDYIAYSIPPNSTADTSVFNDEDHYSGYDAEIYTRTNWLPNIIFPRKISANLMAVALRDSMLIKNTWDVHGSIRYYLDQYLCDHGFYSEEFSKMSSTPGSLLLYCIALKNIGMNELGFGHKVDTGASVRGHIQSLLDITYPVTDLGTSRPRWPQTTIGDMRTGPQGSCRPFQHATVKGYFADSSGGNIRYVQAGAWGGPKRGDRSQWDSDYGREKTDKLHYPLWFEIAHKYWPDAGFDYILAQMRAPGEDYYYPSLFFGLDSIDPDQADPPAAPSAVYPERGLAMLRAKEGPAYWESEAPAVSIRLANYYAHSVNDAFAIAGFYAMNRPVYINPVLNDGYASGYDRSIKSHFAVVVDNSEPQFTHDVSVRKGFNEEVKFFAERTNKRYPGVNETRSIFLTREYMLEVNDLNSSEKKMYTWIVHAMGKDTGKSSSGWTSSSELDTFIPELSNEQSASVAETDWSVSVKQKQGDTIPDILGSDWFAKDVGVKIQMLAQPGMKAYIAESPECGVDSYMPGTSVLSRIEDTSARFTALHEPFTNHPRLSSYQLIEQNPDAIGVSVKGNGVNDRLMLRLGEDYSKYTSLSGNNERFTFANYAYIRIKNDTVKARGDIRSLTINVENTEPVLLINDSVKSPSFSNDQLTYKADTASGTPRVLSPSEHSIYPNPTTGKLHISENNIKQILIRNILGTVEAQFNNKKVIDISEYPSGIYFIELIRKKGNPKQVFRIVKE